MLNFLKRLHFTRERGQARFLRRWVAVWLVVGLAAVFVLYKLFDTYTDRQVGRLLAQLVHSETEGRYAVGYHDVRLLLSRRQLIILNLEVRPVAGSNQSRNRYQALVPRLQIGVESIWDLLVNNELQINSLDVHQPSLTMDNFPNQAQPLTLARESGNLYSLVASYLRRFEVKNFAVRNATFQLNNHYAAGLSSQTFRRVSLSLKNFLLDERAEQNQRKIFYTDALTLEINNQEIPLADSVHVIKFDRLEVNTDSAAIQFHNFQLRPRANPAGRRVYRLNVPLLALRGIDFAGAYHTNQLAIRQIVMKNPVLAANYLANGGSRLAKSPNVPLVSGRQANLAAALAQLFARIHIHDCQLQNARFDFKKNGQSQVQLAQVDIGVKQLEVDSAILASATLLPRYGSLALALRDQVFHLADSAYTLRIGRLTLATQRNHLGIGQVRFQANRPANPLPVRWLAADSLSVAFADFGQALASGQWHLHQVWLGGLQAHLVPTGQPTQPARLNQLLAHLTIQAANTQARWELSELLTSLKTNVLRISQAQIRYHDPALGDSLSVQNLDCQLHQLAWRPGQPLLTVAELFASQRADFKADRLRWHSRARGQQLQVGPMAWTGATSTAYLQAIHWRVFEPGPALATRKTLAQVDCPHLMASHLDLPRLLNQGHWQLGKLQAEAPVVQVRTQAPASTIPAGAKLIKSLFINELDIKNGSLLWQQANDTVLALRQFKLDGGPLRTIDASRDLIKQLANNQYFNFQSGSFLMALPGSKAKLRGTAGGWEARPQRLWIANGQVEAAALGLTFAQAQARGLDWAAWQAGQPFVLDRLQIQQARLTYAQAGRTLALDSLAVDMAQLPLANPTPAALVKTWLAGQGQVVGRRLMYQDARQQLAIAALRWQKGASRPASLWLDNLQLASTDHELARPAAADSLQWRIHLPQVAWHGLGIDSVQARLVADSVSLPQPWVEAYLPPRWWNALTVRPNQAAADSSQQLAQRLRELKRKQRLIRRDSLLQIRQTAQTDSLAQVRLQKKRQKNQQRITSLARRTDGPPRQARPQGRLSPPNHPLRATEPTSEQSPQALPSLAAAPVPWFKQMGLSGLLVGALRLTEAQLLLYPEESFGDFAGPPQLAKPVILQADAQTGLGLPLLWLEATQVSWPPTQPDWRKRGPSNWPLANLRGRTAAFKLPWGQRQLQTAGLQFDLAQQTLALQQLQWQQNGPIQQDWQARQVHLTGVDFNALFSGNGLLIKQLDVPEFTIAATVNRREARTPTIKPLPMTQLRRLPWPLRIDSVRLRNGQVHYQEIMATEAGPPRSAQLHFDQVAASLSPLTNQTWSGLTEAHLQATARLMGSGHLQLNAIFALDSLNGFHQLSLNSQGFDLPALNPFLEPAARVRVERGRLNALSLVAQVTDARAKGRLDMYYESFKFSVLDKRDLTTTSLRSKVSAFLANLLVRNRNARPSARPNSRGEIDLPRPANRSLLGYWARIVISGVISSSTGSQRARLNRAPAGPPQ
jgi:Domain of Unknown Function (DUF748)